VRCRCRGGGRSGAFDVGFEEVTDEDRCGAALRCEDGEELGLDLGEGSFGYA
jgi:hypothetical protein